MTRSESVPTDLAKVGVVGGGLMGSGIAEVLARAGLHVVVIERERAAVEACRARISASLERACAHRSSASRIAWAGGVDAR